MTLIIIRIITSIALWWLYLTAIEKVIISFKDQIDNSQFAWCCFSIGLLTIVFHVIGNIME